MTHEKKVCKDMSFSECELAILRMAVDNAEEKMGNRKVNSEDIQKMIDIVEEFIKRKKLICYGGTAINNILPEEDRFYNKDIEIPDYDFFSQHALDDAKELADLYFQKGFVEIEAKSGQHHGTYKVFVNFMAVADITLIPPPIYKSIFKESLIVNGIYYAPPNFLRMSMYLELSRPAGDISRWEKVLKRLTLLNKNYPITNINCNNIEFQRIMNSKKNNEEKIYETVKNSLISQGVVFFGGFANTLYSQYMPRHLQKKLKNVADFDVLSNNPESTAKIIKERLDDNGIRDVKIIKQSNVGDIIPEHYEVSVDNDSILFIYRPIGCHSYNVLVLKGKKIKVATIDTMLSFYLAFLYANKPYYNQYLDRILCMSKFLFDVQQKNRLSQRGLLRRFSITCYGHQESIEEIKAHKALKYKELKNGTNKKVFEEWFLNYRPDSKATSNSNINSKNNSNINSNSNNNTIKNNNRRKKSNNKNKKTKNKKTTKHGKNKTKKNKNNLFF